MERGKGSSGRGGKSKTPQFPADLFALGSKASNEAKPRSGGHSSHASSKLTGSSSSGERDRKRDGGSLGAPSAVPPKKSKIVPNILNRTLSSSSSSSSTTPSGPPAASTDAWESLALDIEPPELSMHVLEASQSGDTDRAIGLICGALKLLKYQRSKIDTSLFTGLAFLVRMQKNLFINDNVVAALSSLLKKGESGPSAAAAFKSTSPKMNSLVCLLSINLIMKAFQDIKKWPDALLRVYLEDAGGERSWVDHELSKNFVDNIIYSLGTKQSMVVPPEPSSRPEQPEDDLIATLRVGLSDSDNVEVMHPTSRFRWNKDIVEGIVLECVKEQLTRRQSIDLINKNFLKMLSSLCGVGEVRLMVASRLEAWLQNPKLMRSAQELLMSVCVNCCAHTIKDVEVIGFLIKIRLKTKALSNYYLSCIKELISAHPENLGTVLKHTIYNELSTSRNPNNMSVLGAIFQCDPDKAASYLSDIFLELLMNRDDYLRPLRALLRELARVLRHELKLFLFTRGIMSHTEPLGRDVDHSRTFNSTVDIIALCLFLSVMPHARSDKKDQFQLEKMQTTISTIQCDAIWWLQDSVLAIYRPSTLDFVHAIHKVLLLEPAEQYYKTDNWPPEQDRSLFLRMAAEVPVYENTIATLLAIGMSKEHPLTPAEALDLALEIVKRAAAVTNPLIPVLKAEKLKIFDVVFNLSAYRHPENIDLPQGYKPPSLAISALYWKSWTLLLILSAHNPAKFGSLAWEKYPTLRVLMEMCITSAFVFPPGFDDHQMLSLEKQNILEFESHLAAASTKMEITEQTSLLLSQLITMDPLGAPRRPPQATVDTIKALNSPLKLGHLLCRSRNPDFLLDIINRQGASQSMPWLADLVHNSEGALNHLPVQCLCEFLLSSGHKQEGKYQQLLQHLQNILTDANQDPSKACEVLDYFLRRLSSPNNRALAISGLKLLISPSTEDEVIDSDRDKTLSNIKDDPSWLTDQLPTLPHFEAARPQVVQSLRSACQVENEPELVTAYLCFLARHASGDLSEMAELVLDMAQLIVERSTIMSSILPSTDKPNPALDAFLQIFYNYLTKAKEPRREKYTWSESQDQVLVSWPSGEEITVHILVVHAMVILLTYGPHAVSNVAQFQDLLETWFPADPTKYPTGYLVDTSEEALLIPDWLKLKMIRSHVPRLVEAALNDLDIGQLILFIQSFGIPIASMSKLLATLDEAVVSDRQAVGDAVIDKAYMIQLVEVQHKRGAIGGETFVKVLDYQDPQKIPLEETASFSASKKEKREKKYRPEQVFMSEQQMVSSLENLFGQYNDFVSVKEQRVLFTNLQRTLVHHIIGSRDEGGTNSSPFVIGILNYLFKRVATDAGFIRGILSRPHFSCPLFRLLVSASPCSNNLTNIAKEILKHITEDPRIKPLRDVLSQYLSKQLSVEIKSEEMDTDTATADEDHALAETMQKLLIAPVCESGILVDKLVKLEPEILGDAMDLQMKLLFCKSDVSFLECRPYLLTLLTHHASWRTLSNCVEILLQNDSVIQFEPTPVLDFLKALTCNPKLWQGREKHMPKHYKPENVLNFNINQLKILVDYVVAEGLVFRAGSHSKLKHHLSTRLDLLYHCICATDVSYASDIAQHLIAKSYTVNSPEEETSMCQELLIQLYMKLPSLITRLSDRQIENYLIKHSILSVGGSCTADTMSHTLITALSSTPSVKDWSKKSHELDLSLRKMASTHPLLILRQLPLIAAGLRGRVDLDWNVFRYRNHLTFFQQISGLMDLLQPAIFYPQYSEHLHKILDIYLELFANHGREGGSAVANLMTQFAVLIQNYIQHNSSQAKEYLVKQSDLISELQEEYSVMRSYCVIITGFKGTHEVILTPANLVEPPSAQWENKIVQFNKEDPGSLLSFVDYNTAKKPSLLGPIFPTLCSFLSSSSSHIRGLAHTVVTRYLRYNPRAARHAVPSYLTCLSSKNPDVVASALEKLPEVIVCSQELCLPLLRKVFNLAIKNTSNVSSCISKTLALLNQQYGC